MLLELLGGLEALLLLHFERAAYIVPRLMRPQLVDEVMHVDEEKFDVFELLLAQRFDDGGSDGLGWRWLRRCQ